MIKAPPLDIMPRLLHDKQLRTFNRGETITNSEEYGSFWLIKSGYVKRFEIMNDGSICVQSFYGPGEGFSLSYIYTLLFNRKIYTGPEVYYYEALDEVQAWQITEHELLELCHSTPELYRDLLALAGNRFMSNIQLLENKGLPDAKTQVAHQILYFAKRFGEKTPDGVKILLPLTQQDIADVISLTRESVSSAIQKLRREKLLAPSRSMVICDLAKLEAFVFDT